MSNAASISRIAELMKSGQLAEAKRQAKSLLSEAEPHDLQVIAECAHILESWPRIGVIKLRAYWHKANEHDRAIIAACAPENGEQRRHVEPEGQRPRWTEQNKYQAPRDEHREFRPERRRTTFRRTADDGAAVMDAYQRDRAGVDDEPQPAGTAIGYELDYDRAAVSPLHGTPCVCCWIERASVDRAAGHDDGLCVECRDRGRPGIPTLSAGHSRADLIEARCVYIAGRYPAVALRLLRRYWQQCASPHDRDVVASWVAAHNLTAGLSTTAHAHEPAFSEMAACASCGEPRTSRDVRHVSTDDRLCLHCRAAADHEAPEYLLAAV